MRRRGAGRRASSRHAVGVRAAGVQGLRQGLGTCSSWRACGVLRRHARCCCCPCYVCSVDFHTLPEGDTPSEEVQAGVALMKACQVRRGCTQPARLACALRARAPAIAHMPRSCHTRSLSRLSLSVSFILSLSVSFTLSVSLSPPSLCVLLSCARPCLRRVPSRRAPPTCCSTPCCRAPALSAGSPARRQTRACCNSWRCVAAHGARAACVYVPFACACVRLCPACMLAPAHSPVWPHLKRPLPAAALAVLLLLPAPPGAPHHPGGLQAPGG